MSKKQPFETVFANLRYRHIAVVAIKSPAWEYIENKERHITIFVPATLSTVSRYALKRDNEYAINL